MSRVAVEIVSGYSRRDGSQVVSAKVVEGEVRPDQMGKRYVLTPMSVDDGLAAIGSEEQVSRVRDFD